VGYGNGPGCRERLGFKGCGPTAVITDLAMLEPDPESDELTLTQVHEGVDVDTVREATGWELQVAPRLRVTSPPTDRELSALRELLSR
jgi:glutaconate CoA-transferase, subunit B